MWKFLTRLFDGLRGEKTTVRRWTEVEGERVRTFEETTQSSSAGGITFEISGTTEFATSRQKDFLQKLGFSGKGLEKGEASYLIDTILRPVEYALSKTFKNPYSLDKEAQRALHLAIVHWDYYTQLPRYGPKTTWAELVAAGHDPNRLLTKEERMAVTDVAFKALPPDAFLSLESNGVKKYKNQLDATIRQNA